MAVNLGLRPSDTAASRAPSKTEPAPKSAPASFHELKQRERAFILEALAKTGGKIYGSDGAAALLGIKPTTLSSKVHRMGLKNLAVHY
jgi:transcriptional regulator with GAF, ATPase, and Fis domain